MTLLPLPVLTAPTAAGKSSLALELARQFDLEIVSADAFTVYRGLDIGTAKPNRAELRRVPHHLIDVADVTENFDVAQFVTLAQNALQDILNRGRIPLVVGGTGFYLSALIRGLPLTPPSVPAEREAVEQDLQRRGLDALLLDIEQVDPAEARRMERNPRRVVRALEVYRRSGRFPGQFGYSTPAFQYAVTAFTRPGEELEERMRQRTQAMLAGGWPDEAGWLAAQVDPDADPRPTAWQALGYREALGVARGELSVPEAAERIFLATRQYARRQVTWMRSQLGVSVVTPEAAQQALREHLKNW
ncbi:tRNA (adenosine(37)-N6)-dimethylallyltransferase MiaA [Deinococcus fonticola]|uniref:tRNA (adenosine(37)-N6)-dimethylallyltransferase MiaA n=1 Tax=Deinococcus fonticola TaxID=2528713 RepID=UPI001075673A|nr:tRNA (adenosine(37)-N6)-dimethylallyltransferase MiaA [Deinococcus fonticola]